MFIYKIIYLKIINLLTCDFIQHMFTETSLGTENHSESWKSSRPQNKTHIKT